MQPSKSYHYTPLNIYQLVGKDDKVAGLDFKRDSESYALYGSFITVVFEYTQRERETLDDMIASGSQGENIEYVKARYLVFDLPAEKVALLKSKGILSSDIISILANNAPEKNTFHSTQTRELNKINIPFKSMPNGGDYGWQYGFKKELVRDGIGMCPADRASYLASKLYFEEEELTPEEKGEMYVGDTMREDIEWDFLSIKYRRKEASESDKVRLGVLMRQQKLSRANALDAALKETGSSMKKLAANDLDKVADMLYKVTFFRERTLNVLGKRSIYLDSDGYIHIWMRHVKDMKAGAYFAKKDNYQWNEEDVIYVMKNVIGSINDDVQAFFEKNPTSRYSRYGSQSVYYQGDYYTVHIEPTGRISTLYKNKKKHEQS